MARRTILLMRHAEKPADKDDPHLSVEGRARAERLATYLPQEFGRPARLVAAADKPESFRPRETLEPLGKALGLEVVAKHLDSEVTDVAQLLLKQQNEGHALIVIAWRHDHLPKLARALGGKPGECPEPWPENLYDLILRFDYDGPGAPLVGHIIEPF